MDIESKYEKMENILNIKFHELFEFPEKVSALDLYTQMNEIDKIVAFVPAEANFQIPNVFLRTKKVPECEQFLKGNSTSLDDRDLLVSWNTKIDECLNILETFEISEWSAGPENEIVKFDEKNVEKMLKDRF
jgi:hypothetical protein